MMMMVVVVVVMMMMMMMLMMMMISCYFIIVFIGRDALALERSVHIRDPSLGLRNRRSTRGKPVCGEPSSATDLRQVQYRSVDLSYSGGKFVLPVFFLGGGSYFGVGVKFLLKVVT